jgi:hypothetical protein
MNVPDDDGALSVHTQQTLARLAPMVGHAKVSRATTWLYLTL